MTRPPPARTAARLAAVVSIALAGTVLPPAAPALAAPDAGSSTPLEVTLDTMTPSAIPRRGTVTVTGQVTNTSEDTWTDVQAYLLVSESPITTEDGLAEAAGTDPASEVGSRVTRDGLFTEIGDLAPGESTTYSLSVPRKHLEITGEPGVYWVGVHVLGALDGIRDGVADGRARTFMPLMADRGPRTEVAVVVPLRDRVRRSPDGELLGLQRWESMLGPDGRLTRLAGLAAESRQPLTWLVDPAVLDAVSSVARENPPFDTSADGSGPDGEGGKDEGGAASASPSASPSAGDEAGGGDAAGEPSAGARQAADWLTSFVQGSSRSTVLALPYGDIDVAAVTGNRLGRILRKAQTLSRRTLAGLGIDGSPVVAPPSGLLAPRALAAVDSEIPVVLSDRAFPGTPGPLLTRPDGTKVVTLDSAAGSGGPGPNDPRDPLALRQRILAEAAVHAMSPDRDRPLVVSTPPYWEVGASWQGADFFDGLDVPWLSQVDLTTVLSRDDDATPTNEPPAYTTRERRRQVPFANQLATQELVDTGSVYADLLTLNDSVRDQLAKAAMLASSYPARATPTAALDRARSTTLRIRRTMQGVDIDGPGFVMMSSETGPISVTVVNNLDDPVTVRLEATAGRHDLEIASPDPIQLGPGQRAPVRLRARSSAIGVHEVTLVATTEDGRRLGSEVQFNVRSSNVGLVIWLVMGVAGALLLVMIGFRILRRVRARRAQKGPE